MHRWYRAIVVVGGSLGVVGCGGEDPPAAADVGGVDTGATTDTSTTADTGATTDTGSTTDAADTGAKADAPGETGDASDDADACPETCVPGKCIPCIK